MTAAPAAAKKSPARIAANRKFAAAGRAAQAKTRAAAIKKTGKPPPVSKARKAAAVKWAAAGRASQAAARKAAKSGKKAPVTAKKAGLPASQSRWTGPSLWLPGCNDLLPTCNATAIANHLLAATGVEASDADILALHELAGGDNGSILATALEAVSCHGLAGVQLAGFWPVDESAIGPGLVCGVTMRRGYHAVLSHPSGMVSWGMVMAFSGTPGEAWGLEWQNN